MTGKAYKVNLENVFEGPLDLLIHLIKKNDVDIYDIPIASITRQYLQYVELLELLDVDFAGDFIIMASSLIHIKSRMLLPVHESEYDEEEEEDPRLEITRPLLEYIQMKSAAEKLAERNLLGEQIFTRQTQSAELLSDFDQDDQLIKIGLFELIDAFQTILQKVSPKHQVDLTTEKMSVKDKISELVDIFIKHDSIIFEELFQSTSGKSEIIITFLALLEMIKIGLVRVVQHAQSGIIRLFYI